MGTSGVSINRLTSVGNSSIASSVVTYQIGRSTCSGR
uniref:Uncharacterized protein n=1 Tax=Parascaris equorum TaxID=6256 RepID=A0A914RCH3_PAREQ